MRICDCRAVFPPRLEVPVMINIDITLLIQLVNFLVSLALIYGLIIRPIRGILARRRAENDRLRGNAEALENEAGLKQEGYAARIAQARAEVAALRDKVKASAQKSAQEALGAAGEKARAIHQEAIARIQDESRAARSELDGRVDEFARMAVKSMLG